MHETFPSNVLGLFLDICPGVELLGHMVVLFLDFENTSYCFPQWLHQLTFPSTVYKDFLSSIFSPTFVIHVLFIDSHSDRCEVILHCGFDLDFLND